MLAICVGIGIGVFAIPIVAPGWVEPWSLPMLCLLALVFGPLIVQAVIRRSRLRADLACGLKAIRNGVIASKLNQDADFGRTFRIYVSVGDSIPPLAFKVPQDVHDALAQNQAVRIAYAPRSCTLLELESERHLYVAA